MEEDQEGFRFYRCSKKYGNLKLNGKGLDFTDV